MNVPQVTVVIPTRDRPDLVVRAVGSALRQTLPSLEVIVVLDGEDTEAVSALRSIPDERLRVHVAERRGASAARNTGVELARADWIAFLDDDDEMLPHRLAAQFSVAEASKAAYPVVLCRSIARTAHTDAVLPEVEPNAGEPLSEYMFVKKGLFGQSGALGTSLVFAKRDLLRAVPFPDLPRHQDWGWALKAVAVPGAEWSFVPEPLVIYHIDESRSSISRARADWTYSLSWARDHREWMTARAYSAFLMSTVARLARQQGAFGAIPEILRAAIRSGQPRLLDFVLFAAVWLAPARAYKISRDLRFQRQATGRAM